ncbi:MAG: alpha/beta hydrolase [Dehalococcoidia bacterium]
MPTARINGIDIHYEISGEGPAVVFLHGLMGSIDRSRAVGDGLDGLEQRGFRLITYDARGHGASGFTENEADYTWEAHSRDLLGLLDHFGVERAAIGGGSMGAGVSYTFALAHPERVEKLMLIALPPLGEGFEPAKQMFGGFAQLIEGLGLEKAVQVVMQLPEYVKMRERDPEEFARLRDWLLRMQPRGIIFAMRGLVNGPPLADGRFGEIAAPALITAHPDDLLHPIASGQRAHAAIAGSRLMVAPSLLYYRDHRGELLDAVATFLRG